MINKVKNFIHFFDIEYLWFFTSLKLFFWGFVLSPYINPNLFQVSNGYVRFALLMPQEYWSYLAMAIGLANLTSFFFRKLHLLVFFSSMMTSMFVVIALFFTLNRVSTAVPIYSILALVSLLVSYRIAKDRL